MVLLRQLSCSDPGYGVEFAVQLKKFVFLLADRRQSSRARGQESSSNKKLRFKCDYGSTIIAALRGRGWHEVHGEDSYWDLFWCDAVGLKNVLDNRRLDGSQRIAHFRNHYELTRKNFLARNLKRYRKHNLRKGKRQEAELCSCMPTTFELPKEYLMFVEEYRKQPGATWIVKPAAGAQGRGIFLFQKLKDLVEWRNNKCSAKETTRRQQQQAIEPELSSHCNMYVVQRYIEKPYLIAGRKFDMRLYVLVTSFMPLKVWMAREGFARLSSSQFSLEVIGDKRIHVTNMAVQLHPPPEAGSSECKWHVRKLRQFLTARHGPEAVEDLMQTIAKIVMTSLQAVQSIIVQNRHCFELYGYDILLDSHLKPWLLEVNSSPSMGATDPDDFSLKYNLLSDVLNIVDLEGRLTGKERRVGGFDLIWDDGAVRSICPGAVDCFRKIPKSFLSNENKRLNIYTGCLNDREEQLQQIWERGHHSMC